MTLLVGLDGAGWTTIDQVMQSTAGMAVWRTAGHVAVATGTATLAYIHPTSYGLGSNGRIYVYDNNNTLLATSAEISGTGLVSAAINVSIVSGSTYKLVFRPDSGYTTLRSNDNGATFVTQEITMAASYPTGDATLGSGTNNFAKEFIIWLDGASSGPPAAAGLQATIIRRIAG